MESKNFKAQLINYRNKVNKWSKEIIKEDHFKTEQNTTIKFIIPLFEMLGWDARSEEMEFEYAVPDKKTKKKRHVDIALYVKGSKKPATFIEIKPLSGTLTKGSQLLNYLKNTHAKYGIYTNGKEIKLISKRSVRDGYSPRVFFHLKNIDDFIKYSDVLWMLSKSSLITGRLDNLVEGYHKEYWKWKKKNKKRRPKLEKDELPLVFAREKMGKI